MTTTKFWELSRAAYGVGVKRIREWDITLSPFSSVYSQDFSIIGPTIGTDNTNGLVSIDDFTLISSENYNTSTNTQNLLLIDTT
jgi:hypothetical protein